jgi:hypothetical protein
MAKLNKVEGAKETCPSCKEEMVCNSIPGYQGGPSKLQWQNKEGRSHYLAKTFVDDKPVFPCRGVTITGTHGKSIPQMVQETNTVWEKLDEPSDDQKLLVDGLRDVRALAYDFTKEGHPELSQNTNLFGQIVNANMGHILTLALIKATKESS